MPDFAIPKTFDPHINPRQIVLIGVGGTGAHTARLLARLLSHMQALRLNTPTLRLIDPDSIEPKNIGRQLFSAADVGYPKAEVVAKRLSLAFGLGIEWVNEPFDSEKHLGNDMHNTILIDAVDNHLARQAIAKACSRYSRLLISCGNHRDAGQVSIGSVGDRAEMRRYLTEVEQRQSKLSEKDTLRYLPNAYLLFPELLEPETSSVLPEVSCADLLLQQEQDLLINDAVALVAARYVQQLLLRQPIQSFLTFVSLTSMTTIKPVPITLENIHAYLKGESA